jgi:hypothetical protein
MNSNRPTTILCLWDYNSFTGFSTVSKNIKSELKKHFGNDLVLHICAINYHGEPYEEKDGTYVISALKSATKRDDFGRYGFLKILTDSNDYDGIFILQDLAVVVPIIEVLKTIKQKKKEANQRQFKSIFYFPVDNKLRTEECKNLEFFDLLVTYTEYGRSRVLNHRPELQPKLKVIPHGNNSRDFYPLEEESNMAFRKDYFGKNSEKIIISNINRNQSRKDIPSTIFAFRQAQWQLQEKGLADKIFLYLHMNPKDPMGWDIPLLMKQTELKEGIDYMILSEEDGAKGVSVETLNQIYNASDIYLSTTLGEGWGLGITEAFSTKLSVICPLHTSLEEITDMGRRAFVIDELNPCCFWKENIVREQVSIYQTADLITELSAHIYSYDVNAEEKLLREAKIDRAYKYVQGLEWSEICKRWIEYFKEVY